MWRDIQHFVQISRPVNVLISFVAFIVACFLATGTLEFIDKLSFWGTALTIVVIAATGYWINDVYDFRIDRINKPDKAIVNAHLSTKKVLTAYIIVNILILGFSFLVIGLYAGRPQITFINFLSVLLLFVYASYLKRTGVAGNLTISFLIALVLILAYYLTHRLNMALIWSIIFAFEITLIREITKDVEDIKGDLAFKLKTLPIQIGIKGTKRILILLYITFLVSCYLPFLYYGTQHNKWMYLYLILSVAIVQTPTILILRLLVKASNPREFGQQSNYLKYVMLTGMITLFFLS
ncbi:MAG: geranylgeranylglycerol-phosphate geranylgeranyltransferase [Bacteroidota bacterium]